MKNVLKLLAVGSEVTALELKNQDGQLDMLLVVANTVTRISVICAVAYLIAAVELAKLALLAGALLIGLFFREILK